jgi:hypothetical protein
MTEFNLNDAQWCVLDMLMRAREKGVHVLNRMELLSSPSIPQGAAMKLTFAALTIPGELVEWQGKHDFSITEAGVSLYNLRFGTGASPATPTDVADNVICLPDLSSPGPRH